MRSKVRAAREGIKSLQKMRSPLMAIGDSSIIKPLIVSYMRQMMLMFFHGRKKLRKNFPRLQDLPTSSGPSRPPHLLGTFKTSKSIQKGSSILLS